jgi:hypothetical protein
MPPPSAAQKSLLVAFVTVRKGYMMYQAAVIQECLKRGHQVDIYLDHTDLTGSTKAFDFPSIDFLPKFFGGTPNVFTFKGASELEVLVHDRRPDFVFSNYYRPPAHRSSSTMWCLLLTALYDPFFTHQPEQLLKFDMIFAQSQHWAEWGFRFYLRTRQISPIDREQYLERFSKVVFVTGMSQYDGLKLCDPDRIRAELGFEKSDRVVTVFIFEPTSSFWAKRVFREQSRLLRIIYWLTSPFSTPYFFSRTVMKRWHRLLWHSFTDRFRMIQDVFGVRDELATLRAIKEFCVKNNAKLVFKLRKTNEAQDYHLNLPDGVVNSNDKTYPYSSLELVAVSDLVISFFSSAAIETVVANKPHLCIGLKEDLLYRDVFPSPHVDKAQRELFFNSKPEGVFNFEGVVWNWNAERVIRDFPRVGLKDFELNPERRKKYLDTYAGFADLDSASRIVQCVEEKAGNVVPSYGLRIDDWKLSDE